MTEASFDLAEALDQAGGEELLRELAAILLDEGTREMAVARSAEKGGDARTLEAAAHRLRGAVIIFGAKRVGAALDEVEQAARRGIVAECAVLLGRAESEWLVLAGDLAAWLGRAAPAPSGNPPPR
jgi:HPt (histidine-containing phosphotransfer) domain-containing protein